MGQRVILLKTIQGILRERQTVGDGQREKGRRVGGATDRRRYRERKMERETGRKR